MSRRVTLVCVSSNDLEFCTCKPNNIGILLGVAMVVRYADQDDVKDAVMSGNI